MLEMSRAYATRPDDLHLSANRGKHRGRGNYDIDPPQFNPKMSEIESIGKDEDRKSDELEECVVESVDRSDASEEPDYGQVQFNNFYESGENNV